MDGTRDRMFRRFTLAALVCGAGGIFLGVVPKTGFLAVILGGAGVVFAFTAEQRARRAATSAFPAYVAVALSVIAFALGAYGVFLMTSAVEPTIVHRQVGRLASLLVG